jgi:succinate dehydrogenase/fumarate reductase cytochrome b subunit
MSTELTPLLTASVIFGWASGIVFLSAGVYLSIRNRRLHPLLLLCISAISFSWIEAPYDWAMYAQFPPALPRMPSWWPLNMTWGGLPSSVPVGYIGYFCLPAVIGAATGRRLIARFGWRQPVTFLTVGLVGFCWALVFNAGVGARLGVFYYAYVIPGLGLFEGTLHQYPIYDAIAMGIQMMVFTYLLGRTDSQGRNVVEMWSDRVSKTRGQSAIVSVVTVIVVGNVLYGAVFAPHLVTMRLGYVTSGTGQQLFPGVPNQPR